jgi:ABC-type transport system involved in Fe-S cluster assembly fused permease/ATPase subunit
VQAKVPFYKRCFGVLSCVHPHFLLYSYLLFSLFSVVELENGKIEIDGYNVRSVGLDVLRRGLALVPQDSTLFLGTLRDNL